MVQSVSQYDFHHRLEETPGPALVLFTAPACGSCRHWKALLAEYQGGHPEVTLFEVDAGRDPALVQEFEVFHLPAVYLYLDGEYHAAVNCAATLAELERTLAHLITQPAEEAP